MCSLPSVLYGRFQKQQPCLWRGGGYKFVRRNRAELFLHDFAIFSIFAKRITCSAPQNFDGTFGK
jgi:hypothetical protein